MSPLAVTTGKPLRLEGVNAECGEPPRYFPPCAPLIAVLPRALAMFGLVTGLSSLLLGASRFSGFFATEYLLQG